MQDRLRLGNPGAGNDRARGVVAERDRALDGGRDHREAGSVVEDGLHVHLGDHVGDARQDIARAQHAAGLLDGLREPLAIARRLADRVRDQRGGLRDVQFQATGPPGPGQLRSAAEQQPVALRRGQPHADPPPLESMG